MRRKYAAVLTQQVHVHCLTLGLLVHALPPTPRLWWGARQGAVRCRCRCRRPAPSGASRLHHAPMYMYVLRLWHDSAQVLRFRSCSAAAQGPGRGSIGMALYQAPDRHIARLLKAIPHRIAGLIRPAPAKSAFLLMCWPYPFIRRAGRVLWPGCSSITNMHVPLLRCNLKESGCNTMP